MSIGTLASGVLAYAFNVLAARALGPAAYSAVGALWGGMFLLAVLLFRPIEQTISRAVADKIARGEDGRGVLRSAAGLADEVVLADARDPIALAEAVGVRDVGGYLAGGMTSWREERRPVRRTPRIDVAELRRRRDEVQVLDVRERTEWDAGHIAGSLFMPYHDIRELPEGLDPERPVAVICASGQRSAVAASLLERLGAREVIHVVDGGVAQYLAAT
jgi:rhodanese-related sulfurtransferase